jgi:hypothetical protein
MTKTFFFSLLLLMQSIVWHQNRIAGTLNNRQEANTNNKNIVYTWKNNDIGVKPIALVYQTNKETEPVGGWILNQTSNSLKMRVFSNNHDWEFIGREDGGIVLKISSDKLSVKKLLVAAGVVVTNPTSELLHKNGYVSVYAEGNIPTPAKIITSYAEGKNRGGSCTVQLPFSDGAKIIELSWNAFNGKWGCSQSSSSYIPVGKKIYDIYVYDETNGEEILTNSNAQNNSSGANTQIVSNNEMPGHPSMAKIVFADGKEFYANAISQSARQILIRMISNSEEYTISNKGIILTSTGSYAKGSKVQSVMIKKAGKSIYNEINQANFNYGVLGFEFPDGKVQYASALTIHRTYLAITMQHSGFNYDLYYKNGEWKIDNAGGEYRNGTIIKDIFELDNSFKKFY